MAVERAAAAMAAAAMAASAWAASARAAAATVAVAWAAALPVVEAKAVGMVAPTEELAKRRSSSLSVSHN